MLHSADNSDQTNTLTNVLAAQPAAVSCFAHSTLPEQKTHEAHPTTIHGPRGTVEPAEPFPLPFPTWDRVSALHAAAGDSATREAHGYFVPQYLAWPAGRKKMSIKEGKDLGMEYFESTQENEKRSKVDGLGQQQAKRPGEHVFNPGYLGVAGARICLEMERERKQEWRARAEPRPVPNKPVTMASETSEWSERNRCAPEKLVKEREEKWNRRRVEKAKEKEIATEPKRAKTAVRRVSAKLRPNASGQIVNNGGTETATKLRKAAGVPDDSTVKLDIEQERRHDHLVDLTLDCQRAFRAVLLKIEDISELKAAYILKAKDSRAHVEEVFVLDFLEDEVRARTTLTEFGLFVKQYNELGRCLDQLVLKGFGVDCVALRQEEDNKLQQAKCQSIFSPEELQQHLNKSPSKSEIPPAAPLLVHAPFRTAKKDLKSKVQEQEPTWTPRKGSVAPEQGAVHKINPSPVQAKPHSKHITDLPNTPAGPAIPTTVPTLGQA